ncbi:hypothetical protein LAZ67_9000997 [Cordylochernes scorpioides]|uniref:Uncharacterized protein n=1 Tax=Cordylochernes scorpioides TaxID=51811 RepID=A0ABY6KST0_9ARAC|nr:hypothetical protein LAZ67_9000997 [Cordylochernes scorpioides]
MIRTSLKFVPRILTEEQKEVRMDVCKIMVEMTRTDPEWMQKSLPGMRHGCNSMTRKPNVNSANGLKEGNRNPKRQDLQNPKYRAVLEINERTLYIGSLYCYCIISIMPRRKQQSSFDQVSEFDRGRIVVYHREIGSRAGRNQITIMQICDRWMQEDTTDRRVRSHPPQCATSLIFYLWNVTTIKLTLKARTLEDGLLLFLRTFKEKRDKYIQRLNGIYQKRLDEVMSVSVNKNYRHDITLSDGSMLSDIQCLLWATGRVPRDNLNLNATVSEAPCL